MKIPSSTAETATRFRQRQSRSLSTPQNSQLSLSNEGGGDKRKCASCGTAEYLLTNARLASASLEGDDDAEVSADARVSLLCPLPRRRMFYSRAYTEYKEKQKNRNKHKTAVRFDCNSHGSSSHGEDMEIQLTRDLTRRKRNSFKPENQAAAKTAREQGAGDYGGVRAYLAARAEAEKPSVVEENRRAGALLAGLAKAHMTDLTIVGGRDGGKIRASRFFLACHSSVLEDAFFKKGGAAIKSPMRWSYDAEARTLTVDFCTGVVLQSALVLCVTGEYPPELNVVSPDEDVARNLAQLDRFAQAFQIRLLAEQVYRTVRKLINRRPVLSCAVFDELSSYQSSEDLGVGVVAAAEAYESIKKYSLETMRDLPLTTLLGGGVQWMEVNSLEAIMQDQDLDVDEFYMFKILKSWENGAVRIKEDRMAIARKFSEHIELKFIDVKQILDECKASGYFTDKKIHAAVELIEESLTNAPEAMERVLVEGAGSTETNGVYVRVFEDMGLGEEEFLFVKEADDGFSDVGLYLYNQNWQIAMCTDYSNCFYTCADDPDRLADVDFVPAIGWKTLDSGQDPPPKCTFLPKQERRMCKQEFSSENSTLAPNLEEMMDPTIVEKRRSFFVVRGADDATEKRTMTLEQMMNLPVDGKD